MAIERPPLCMWVKSTLGFSVFFFFFVSFMSVLSILSIMSRKTRANRKSSSLFYRWSFYWGIYGSDYCCCSSTFYFGWFEHLSYVEDCHDYSGGSWSTFGGCACRASVIVSRFGESSTITSATSFCWWVMIALWQFVTKRGSTFGEEILLLGGDFCCFGAVEPYIVSRYFILYLWFWLMMYFCFCLSCPW